MAILRNNLEYNMQQEEKTTRQTNGPINIMQL